MKSIKFKNGQTHKINNVFCIGRNYSEHIQELGNKAEETPVVFLKTTTSIETSDILKLPTQDFSNNIHHEVELVLYIEKDADNIQESQALDIIGGYAIGLDLTARDIQDQLKAKGLPWELSKSFKNAGWVSEFHNNFKDENLLIELYINNELKQTGTTQQMIFSIPYLIKYLSNIYGLRQGDLIYTGTPSGVGKLNSGDNLTLNLNHNFQYQVRVH